MWGTLFGVQALGSVFILFYFVCLIDIKNIGTGTSFNISTTTICISLLSLSSHTGAPPPEQPLQGTLVARGCAFRLRIAFWVARSRVRSVAPSAFRVLLLPSIVFLLSLLLPDISVVIL